MRIIFCHVIHKIIAFMELIQFYVLFYVGLVVWSMFYKVQIYNLHEIKAFYVVVRNFMLYFLWQANVKGWISKYRLIIMIKSLFSTFIEKFDRLFWHSISMYSHLELPFKFFDETFKKQNLCIWKILTFKQGKFK